MSNKRRPVAVILSICMICALITAAFAAQAEAHERLNTLGILIGPGTGITDEYLDRPALRIDAAILTLKLKGSISEAESYTGELNFADSVEALSEYSKTIMGYLKANPDIGFVGYLDRFDPNAPVTDMMIYKVLLTVLGYDQGKEFEWSETLAAAKYFAGMTTVAGKGELTIRDLADAIAEALDAEIKNRGIILIQQLVNDGVITSDGAKAAGWIFIQ